MAVVPVSLISSPSPPTPPSAAERSSAYFAASNSKPLLEAAVRVSRAWMIALSVHQTERQTASRLVALAESLIRNEDASSAGLFNVRTLMCGNCQRLNAAEGKCEGQSLERCLLLKAPRP